MNFLTQPELMSALITLKTTAIWAGYGFGSVLVFTMVYTVITPCHEWKMLGERNKAALASLQGAMFGFAFPILVSVVQNHRFLPFACAVVASAVVQLVLYALISIFAKNYRQRMNEGDEVAGKWLAGLWLLGGLCTAAAIVNQ